MFVIREKVLLMIIFCNDTFKYTVGSEGGRKQPRINGSRQAEEESEGSRWTLLLHLHYKDSRIFWDCIPTCRCHTFNAHLPVPSNFTAEVTWSRQRFYTIMKLEGVKWGTIYFVLITQPKTCHKINRMGEKYERILERGHDYVVQFLIYLKFRLVVSWRSYLEIYSKFKGNHSYCSQPRGFWDIFPIQRYFVLWYIYIIIQKNAETVTCWLQFVQGFSMSWWKLQQSFN